MDDYYDDVLVVTHGVVNLTQSKLAGYGGRLVTTSLFLLSCAAQPGSGGLPLTWIIVGGVAGGVVVIGILVLLCVIIVAGMWITAEEYIHDCSMMCIILTILCSNQFTACKCCSSEPTF